MTVKMKAPEDNKSGAGFDGEFYPIDEEGCVTVPDEAIEPLQGFGFTVAAIDEAPEADEELEGYTIKSTGFGKYKILKGDEEIAKGLSKADAEAQVAVLSVPKAPAIDEAPEADAAAPAAE